MALYDAALAQKPEVVALNKLDLPEVQERKAQVLEDLRGIGVDAYCISAATHEGVDAVLDGALKMLSEQSVTPPSVEQPIPVLTPKPRRNRPFVERDGRYSCSARRKPSAW